MKFKDDATSDHVYPEPDVTSRYITPKSPRNVRITPPGILRISSVFNVIDFLTKRDAFLQNHREVIAAFYFFTVPTVTFRVLYCFFVIEHERRKILHCNVTPHPTAEWIVQQLREAFPEP